MQFFRLSPEAWAPMNSLNLPLKILPTSLPNIQLSQSHLTPVTPSSTTSPPTRARKRIINLYSSTQDTLADVDAHIQELKESLKPMISE